MCTLTLLRFTYVYAVLYKMFLDSITFATNAGGLMTAPYKI